MRTALLTLLLAGLPLAAQAPEEVRLDVAPDLTIVADLYRASGPDTAPAILLFHQGGGDARGEYADIVPRLIEAGFHVLSTDVRGGGSRFAGTHRAPATDAAFGYCDALLDVEAALSLARANGLMGPLILWGSSYTATLVLHVAARRSADVRAVLAFSPAAGEPMEGCQPHIALPLVLRAGAPVLIVRASGELEDAGRRADFERFGDLGARTFVAAGAGHGSSILVAARFEGDVAPQWEAVFAFLQDVRAPRGSGPSDAHVTIDREGWRLHGDLVRPAGDREAPFALLLHQAAGDRRVYGPLARELAARGIGSLRIDLRRHGESTNLGRFIPYVSPTGLADTHADVIAALAWLRAQPGIDTTRIGIVSASYSGEAVAVALREGARARAVITLSPGNFSDVRLR